ncbi:hypothetical protein JTB14_013954 [Gonioctena quinquepunctata]|nr:hypothetical protein JTB14_013954 [Gonioctena quinquepunctata]
MARKFGEKNFDGIFQNINNSSHNSQVSLERQRIAIEMEKKKQTLEKQKLEIDNNMRLLQMEHDLENARLDAIEEVRSHRSQSNGTNEKTTISTQQRNKVPHCLYPEVMVVNDKSSSSDREQFDLEVASKHKFIITAIYPVMGQENHIQRFKIQYKSNQRFSKTIIDIHFLNNFENAIHESIRLTATNEFAFEDSICAVMIS